MCQCAHGKINTTFPSNARVARSVKCACALEAAFSNDGGCRWNEISLVDTGFCIYFFLFSFKFYIFIFVIISLIAFLFRQKSKTRECSILIQTESRAQQPISQLQIAVGKIFCIECFAVEELEMVVKMPAENQICISMRFSR